MNLGRDAFHARYRFLLPKRKEERYQARLIAQGKCVRCREDRGRRARYCRRCQDKQTALTKAWRAKVGATAPRKQGNAA